MRRNMRFEGAKAAVPVPAELFDERFDIESAEWVWGIVHVAACDPGGEGAASSFFRVDGGIVDAPILEMDVGDVSLEAVVSIRKGFFRSLIVVGGIEVGLQGVRADGIQNVQHA